MPSEGPFLLLYIEVATRHFSISFPNENRAGRIAAVKRIEEVAHARRGPDLATLHLRKTQIAILDHVNELAHCGVNLGHSAPRGSVKMPFHRRKTSLIP